MGLEKIDLVILGIYGVILISIAYWVSRNKSGHERNSQDYFLAGKSLPWWAIGASLIAANISAEQIIGMSGSGYAIGLAIASYEWMAAITLIIVGKYFLPIFLERKIYTMPQYLEQRYNGSVRTVMAVFWVGVYVFVNLTSILWLGALAINTVTGLDQTLGLVLLAGFAALYSLYGGLKAVAFTDIIQVTLLTLGGLFIAYLTLDKIGDGAGVVEGFLTLTERASDKFDMILTPDNPHYISLPGISVLIGGMWIMNISYWGFNQYIIQRALAARSLKEAQKGIAFAAYLKLLMPVIVVLPGLAAVILAPDLSVADKAYPEMMKLAPAGIKGLIFAALIAAIVSSVGSMMNSISTIFTMDIYRHLKKDVSESSLVNLGRIVGFSALVIAVISAKPLLGKTEQAFQYIQDFTGFFTPGIVVIFLLGMFWPRANAAGAMAAAIGSAVVSLVFYIYLPEFPFIDRVGYVFLFCMIAAIVISLIGISKPQTTEMFAKPDFTTSTGFNAAAIGVVIILAALYTTWW